MKISLKNVGMLDEANFEVGDLTIICGENNTGKTYATYSLYGYLDFIKNNVDNILYHNILEEYNQKMEIENLNITISITNFEKFLIDIFDKIFQKYIFLFDIMYKNYYNCTKEVKWI